jgi:hypothetical protein
MPVRWTIGHAAMMVHHCHRALLGLEIATFSGLSITNSHFLSEKQVKRVPEDVD